VAVAAAASALKAMAIGFDCVHAREGLIQVQEAQKKMHITNTDNSKFGDF
jgi:hypothetical protein